MDKTVFEWLADANDDFDYASEEYKLMPYSYTRNKNVWRNCQLAAEKALKAVYLINYPVDTLPKIHKTNLILSFITTDLCDEKTLQDVKQTLNELGSYGGKGRYLDNEFLPENSDCDKAIKNAGIVVEWAENIVKQVHEREQTELRTLKEHYETRIALTSNGESYSGKILIIDTDNNSLLQACEDDKGEIRSLVEHILSNLETGIEFLGQNKAVTICYKNGKATVSPIEENS